MAEMNVRIIHVNDNLRFRVYRGNMTGAVFAVHEYLSEDGWLEMSRVFSVPDTMRALAKAIIEVVGDGA